MLVIILQVESLEACPFNNGYGKHRRMRLYLVLNLRCVKRNSALMLTFLSSGGCTVIA